jgi:SAM-dependent methyltransferase
LRLIVCPNCRSSLDIGSDRLFCTNEKCCNEYDVVEGIPILLPEKIAKEQQLAIDIWSKEYRALLREGSFNFVDQYAKSDFALISDHIDQHQNLTLLEMGCGRARLSSLAAERGYKIYGMDISLDGLLLAKSYFRWKGIQGHFINGDMCNIPIRSNSIDIIFGGGVIEHAIDTQRIVSGMVDVLKPGGICINTVPIISLSTLTQGLLTGTVPELPLLKRIYSFIHNVVFKEKFLYYGYEKSMTIGQWKKIFSRAGAYRVIVDMYDVEWTLKFFHNSLIRIFIQKLLKYRPFWPMVSVTAMKRNQENNSS